MDINNVSQQHDAYEDETRDRPPSSAASGASSVSGIAAGSVSASAESTALLAMMQQMQHQLLALQQSKLSGSAPAGKVPGLKPGDIDRLRSEGRCFNCKEKGHSKRDCTKPLRLKW